MSERTLRDEILAALHAFDEGLSAPKTIDRILAIPQIADALKLAVVKPLNLGHSISTGTRKDD